MEHLKNWGLAIVISTFLVIGAFCALVFIEFLAEHQLIETALVMGLILFLALIACVATKSSPKTRRPERTLKLVRS